MQTSGFSLKLEDLEKHVVHLPDGSKGPEELHPSCPPTWGIQSPVTWCPQTPAPPLFVLQVTSLLICWVYILIIIYLLFPTYMRDFSMAVT